MQLNHDQSGFHAMWRVVRAFIVALLAALMLTQKAEAAQQIQVNFVGMSRSAWRITFAFVVGLLALAALCAPRAEADSMRASCDIYATNPYDPVGHAHHQHRQFGNTSLTDESTGESLYENKDSSCEAGWWTNAGWFPEEMNESVPNAIVYYRGPETDDSRIVDIPRGMELIARNTVGNTIGEVRYNCDASPGNTTPMQATPPYDCTENWATHVTFPRCWDGIGIEHTDVVYGPTRQACPITHPYRLPEIQYVIRHPNTDGVVPNPLLVSGDDGAWLPYTSMHADYFFAAQDEFSRAVDLNGDGRIQDNAGTASYAGGYSESSLLDLCIRKAPEGLEFNNARCRAGGLLSWHQRAIYDFYN
jgi:hypothetical protein